MDRLIYTIGHSNRSMDDLVEILKQLKIAALLDVRRYPDSQRFPQFSQEVLSVALARIQIDYHWLGEQLGGYRAVGYDQYVETESFQKGVLRLQDLAEIGLSAIMCAEKDFNRCHRRFIADALTRTQWRVVHIIESDFLCCHQLGIL
jgi:uncharacterized protein (DUF488 family)